MKKFGHIPGGRRSATVVKLKKLEIFNRDFLSEPRNRTLGMMRDDLSTSFSSLTESRGVFIIPFGNPLQLTLDST